MTSKDFFELTGEDPRDVLGEDWENIVQELDPEEVGQKQYEE